MKFRACEVIAVSNHNKDQQESTAPVLTCNASTLASCSCMWLAEPGRGNLWNGLGAELLPPADAGGDEDEAACADDDRMWPGLVELSAVWWCGWCPLPPWCGWCLSSARPFAEAIH